MVIHDVAELEQMELQDAEVMVIGGAQIYGMMLPKMQRLYVSEVAGEFEADTWFPPFAELFTKRTVVERFKGFELVLYEKQNG